MAEDIYASKNLLNQARNLSVGLLKPFYPPVVKNPTSAPNGNGAETLGRQTLPDLSWELKGGPVLLSGALNYPRSLNNPQRVTILSVSRHITNAEFRPSTV